MKCQERAKVFVGLSGGVDSSVSAALLKKAGFDVTGVFIRVWQPDFFECTAKDDRLDAMRVCARLRIPFMELDLEKEYKKEVVDYMIREYRAGKTPNPDVMCNRFIKFGGFYRWAMKNGANFIATGHYAQIVDSSKLKVDSFSSSAKNLQLTTNNFKLYAGSDSSKDQSYFLWQIKKEQLPHILFPVGGMKKSEVRKLAKKFDLVTADKKDSQGLCFIGKIDMKDFLRHYIKEKSGNVCDEHGTVLGKHRGAFFYTIGERFSSIAHANGGQKHPYYVVKKNMQKNSITVSQKTSDANVFGMVLRVKIAGCNWFCLPKKGVRYDARTRYRQKTEKATIITNGSEATVEFVSPQEVAPGQSLVVYNGHVCFGGGIIL